MRIIDRWNKGAKNEDMSTRNPYPYYEQNPPGANVRAFREERGWTQAQLCRLVILPNGNPLTVSGLSRIESNTAFTKSSLDAIARAFGRPLTDLLTPLHLLNLPPEIQRFGQIDAAAREPIRKLALFALPTLSQPTRPAPTDADQDPAP